MRWSEIDARIEMGAEKEVYIISIRIQKLKRREEKEEEYIWE